MAAKVHRVRYYNPKPLPINCVSFNIINKNLAVARIDASIEIWDINYAPYMIKFIPGVDNGSVEALGWAGDRLLSTGLGGALIEWDLSKLCIKNTVLLTGYAAWCLDVNAVQNVVAVGTEQGYINLFSVDNDEIVYKKLFDKQEGRIMCCKFNKLGKMLVTGSIDSIRVWNVDTGHAVNRMTVGRHGKETIVWSVAVLSDNVIVSGDSFGRLSFWDSELCEQIESYTTHKADILSIVVSDDERSIYCSGVDPVIVNFVKVNSASGKEPTEKWVKNVQRHIHEHDVRALAINDEQLLSAGADGYLTFSSYPPKWVMRIPPMIPMSRSSVCVQKKLLFLRYRNHMEIWKLGSYGTNESGNVMINNEDSERNSIETKNDELEQDSTILTIDETNINRHQREKKTLKLIDNPLKLISIQTKKKKQILCCEMAPTGEFIFYSTDSYSRILKVDIEMNDNETTASVCKMAMGAGELSACSHASFSCDARRAVASCPATRALLHLRLDPDAPVTVLHTIPADNYINTSSVLHLMISKKCKSGATYLIVADTYGAVAIWTLKKNKFEHYVTLPTYKCVPSAVTVDPQLETFIAVYVDQKVLEYELVEKRFSEWSRSGGGVSRSAAWGGRRAAAAGVVPHPRRHALLVHDDTALWVIDRTQKDESEPTPKKASLSNYSKSNLNVIPMKYLAGFHWLGDDEAVAVEVLPENIVAQLPPSLGSNKFYNV